LGLARSLLLLRYQPCLIADRLALKGAGAVSDLPE